MGAADSDAPERGRRNRVGAVSLAVAVAGAALCHGVVLADLVPDTAWLRVLAAGFEAAVVGGLADWFAVTALFRQPLGLPIPHTGLVVKNRARLIDGIVTMVQDEWLSPDVIGARLARVAPSTLLRDWLTAPEHVERLGGPLRDLLRGLAGVLAEPEVTTFAGRTLARQLRALPLADSLGAWLAGPDGRAQAGAAFDAAARSLANLADQPRATATLQFWLRRSAETLRADGKRLVPFLLRQRAVQHRLIEAICGYASTELRSAVGNDGHPLRVQMLDALERFAERLAAGDAAAVIQAEQLRDALVAALETGPLVEGALHQLRAQLEVDLDDPGSALSTLVDRTLRTGILAALDDPERRAAFDAWIRVTIQDLLRRHHHQIGLTVRENLERIDDNALVAQIEARVGADLQFIRLNGAVVGGLIGVGLAILHLFVAR